MTYIKIGLLKVGSNARLFWTIIGPFDSNQNCNVESVHRSSSSINITQGLGVDAIWTYDPVCWCYVTLVSPRMEHCMYLTNPGRCNWWPSCYYRHKKLLSITCVIFMNDLPSVSATSALHDCMGYPSRFCTLQANVTAVCHKDCLVLTFACCYSEFLTTDERDIRRCHYSRYMASNSMADEWWIGKNLEGSGRPDHYKVIFWHLSGTCQDTPWSGRDSNPTSLKYKYRALPLHQSARFRDERITHDLITLIPLQTLFSVERWEDEHVQGT
jgi:hypothetical protein